MGLVFELGTVAAGQLARPGGIGLAAAAGATGVALLLIGMTQERILPGTSRWLIQVAHLGLALLAVGLGEMTAGRASKASKTGGALPSAGR